MLDTTRVRLGLSTLLTVLALTTIWIGMVVASRPTVRTAHAQERDVLSSQRVDIEPKASASRTAKNRELHEAMEEMGGAFRQVMRGIRNPESDPATLEHLTTLQRNLVIAKTELPDWITELENEDKTRAETAYRLASVNMLAEVVAIEQALLSGDREGAMLRAQAMGPMIEQAHEQFMHGSH